MEENKHKSGKELQKQTDEKIKTFSDFIDYLEEQPASDVNSEMIKYFEQEIDHMNGAPNSLRWYITKERAAKFLEWEAKQ